MPYRRIVDHEQLQALLGAVLLIESDLDLDAVLMRIVTEAVRLSGARYGALGVLHPSERRLSRFVHVGMDEEAVERIGRLPEGRGILGVLIDQPEILNLADLHRHPASVGFPPGHPEMRSFLGVPVRVRGEVYGNLYLAEKMGADRFDERDEDITETLALAAGISIANARLHQRVSELSVAEDRDRIARDLHDSVIQRLYGIGLSLQGTLGAIETPRVRQVVGATLDELDSTIRQIRTSIFELEEPPRAAVGVRARVLELTTEASRGLGFDPEVRFAGPIEALVEPALADQALAVLREALSNVARHAHATKVEVELGASDGWLHVLVRDDGVGVVGTGGNGGQGLKNMAERAAEIGGTFGIGPGPGGGTEVSWDAPC